jgi:hypothetical protein
MAVTNQRWIEYLEACEMGSLQQDSITYENGMGVVRILSKPVRASTSWFKVPNNKPVKRQYFSPPDRLTRGDELTDGGCVHISFTCLQSGNIGALCSHRRKHLTPRDTEAKHRPDTVISPKVCCETCLLGDCAFVLSTLPLSSLSHRDPVWLTS